MTISNDFEKITKKNKHKNRLKTVVISVVISLLSILLVVMGMREMTKQTSERMKERYLMISEIAYPNIDYSTWGFNANSEFTGTFYSNRFKNIDGIKVPFEDYQANYSLIVDSVNQNEGLEGGDNNSSNYTHGNLYKVPIFYNVNASAKTVSMEVTQDISKVTEMTGQAVEVAITFDKPYTYQEIIEMVPDNLLVNWYWIGTSSTVDTANLNLAAQLGFTPNDDDYTAGFKNFKSNLKKAIKSGAIDSQYSMEGETLSLEDDAKTYLESNSNAKTATFAGIIVTGRAENFAQLENKDWIYASNIGQSATIQPYHTLTK